MFRWLKKKPQRLDPESAWTIAVAREEMTVCDDAGRIASVAKGDLSRVVLETNDSGPWGADVWWLLFGSNDEMACAFPQGATGEDAAIDYLSRLPAFDHGKMIEAMRSTNNATFPVWQRPA